jgi:hypothetical protein
MARICAEKVVEGMYNKKTAREWEEEEDGEEGG